MNARRALLACTLGSALACAPPGPGPRPDSDTTAPADPVLVDFALSCSLADERWTLTATADAWTGGGTLSWSADLTRVEVHEVRSVSAAPDGDADALRLVLPIVGDWREASPGSSTAMRCRQNPSYVFVLRALDGEASDCATGGPDPDALAALPGVIACP